MQWRADYETFREFKAAARTGSDAVFILGVIGGRSCHLTLATALEEDNRCVVRAINGRWLASVAKKGRGASLTELRLRPTARRKCNND